MKRLVGFSLVVLSGLGIASVGRAQDAAPMKPPKVLVIQREYLKPGRSGSLHEKSEAGFVQAMTNAKWPTHYFAATSLSGRPRALFFVGYPSFEAWEKDNQAMDKNATLTAALDKAGVIDGDLQTESGQTAFVYREDLSLRADGSSLAHMRYFEITQMKIKPGHEREWDELAKMYRNGFEKASPDARAAIFEAMYGQDNTGVFLIITPMKSMAEIDQEEADMKKFMGVVGEAGMKRLGELTAACVETSQTNLFQFSPKMSYPEDSWVKADGAFWKPKAGGVAKKVVPGSVAGTQ